MTAARIAGEFPELLPGDELAADPPAATSVATQEVDSDPAAPPVNQPPVEPEPAAPTAEVAWLRCPQHSLRGKTVSHRLIDNGKARPTDHFVSRIIVDPPRRDEAGCPITGRA
jgi:hypothetical protein